MSTKKAKAKKKSGSLKKNVESGTPSNFALAFVPTEHVEWVTLDLKLLNWSYMNFKIRVKTSTMLFVIKKKIEDRHGRMTDLKICKEQFSERSEMTDQFLTLKSYGIIGSTDPTIEMICPIYYDFKPLDHDDPLLLVT